MVSGEDFWIVEAAGFVALAIYTAYKRDRIAKKTHPAAHEAPEVFIAPAVVDALSTMLVVEIVGFLLTAVAAVFSGLS